MVSRRGGCEAEAAGIGLDELCGEARVLAYLELGSTFGKPRDRCRLSFLVDTSHLLHNSSLQRLLLVIFLKRQILEVLDVCLPDPQLPAPVQRLHHKQAHSEGDPDATRRTVVSTGCPGGTLSRSGVPAGQLQPSCAPAGFAVLIHGPDRPILPTTGLKSARQVRRRSHFATLAPARPLAAFLAALDAAARP